MKKQYQQKELACDMHLTDAAVTTCMVFVYHRDHIHFTDGSEYVSAAKKLKKRG